MLTPLIKKHACNNLSAILTVLWLFSSALYAQNENLAPLPESPSVQAGINSPPVQQTLVPESILATQLANALKLGDTTNEAKAESLLSGVGIEPDNGWIADYPVTPTVLGDIEKDVSAASDSKKIAFTKKQALKVLSDLKNRLGLNVSPGTISPANAAKSTGNTTIYSYVDKSGVVHFTDVYQSIPKAYQGSAKVVSQSSPHAPLSDARSTAIAPPPDSQYLANPNPDDINDYYYQQGPPILTYYAPPDPYAYLYSWVAYPFWSSGYYFPGYFILNNFHRQVVYNQHPYFVANHSNAVNAGHPLNISINKPPQFEAPPPNGMTTGRAFSTPNAQAGANAIMTFNPAQHRTLNTEIARQPAPAFGDTARMPSHAPVFSNNRSILHNGYRNAPYENSGMVNQPAFVPNPPRYYNAPTYSQEPAYRTPPVYNGNISGGWQQQGNVFGGFQEGHHFGGHHGGNFGGFGGARGGGHR